MQELIEVLLRHHADRRVILGLDGCRSFRAREQRNLTEVLSRAERAHESLLTVLILYEALALSLGNDKEIVCCLTLLNFNLFWLTHYQLDLCDHVVFDV